MGKLIATTQSTIDGVIDPVGEGVQPGGDHADYSFERQAGSSGLVLGRKTYEGLIHTPVHTWGHVPFGHLARRGRARPHAAVIVCASVTAHELAADR